MNTQEMQILITKAKNGDSASFGKLYSQYAEQLYRFALYTLKNTHDAEDAVQNAALTAWRSIRDLKKDGSFKSWFFKILYNECMKTARDKSRREIPVEDVSACEAPVFPDEDSADIPLLLSSLSEKEKSVVILTVLEEYSSKETASILGIPAGSVRSILSRSLAKLRKQTEGAKDE